MSFGKLLAAGKSVIGANGGIAYRKDKRVYLPKFGSPKNPFVASENSETQKSEPEYSVAAEKKIPTPAKKAISATAKVISVEAVRQKNGTAWASKLNPMAMLRGSSEAKEIFRSAVQDELSLDSIKVVHNDLTDAEVEIIPIKSRPSAENSKPDSQLSKQTWEILSERFVGIKTT